MESRLAKPMRSRFRFTTEAVFLIAGLLIILLGWASDLIGVLSGDGGGHGGSANVIDRVFFTFFGLLFVAGGTVYERHWTLLNDSLFAKRYLVSLLFIADGAFHLYAATDHLEEHLWQVAFFTTVAGLQIGVGVGIPRLGPRFDGPLLAGTSLLLVAYVVTRTVAIWPVGIIEEVEPLGLVSKFTEVLTILLLVSLMREQRTLSKDISASADGTAAR